MTEWILHGLQTALDFSYALNASISAGWLILAVIGLRFLLKRVPKWLHVALWGLVAVRLLLPYSIESKFSLIPSTETVPRELLTSEGTGLQEKAYLEVISNPVYSNEVAVELEQSVDRVQIHLLDMNGIWILGMVLLLLYAAISCWRLHRRVCTAVRLQENIFQSEYVSFPFVWGIVRPRIYLPYFLSGKELEYVVAHEQAHIHRKDHWWKPLGFLLMSIHWFNPLMWLAYILLCRDIELACDEQVIKEMDGKQKADYTQALVACSVDRRLIAACPLAFGEVGVKERVKAVLHYKKPAFWVVVLAVALCAVIALCFLTDPVGKDTMLMGANYDISRVVYTESLENADHEIHPLQYSVTGDYHLYVLNGQGEDWQHLGALVSYDLNAEKLQGRMLVDELRRDADVGRILDAYKLNVPEDYFYLVFQTTDGRNYLAYGWEDAAERGQAGSDDTRVLKLYELTSSFQKGYVNVNFFQRSLVNIVGNPVYSFANYESDRIPGYHIVGFKSGSGKDYKEMTDMGFAVFESNGEGYRLLDCHVYKDAALVENGIYFCPDPAIADKEGELRKDSTFDVILICNENVEKIERIYQAEGKKDRIQTEGDIHTLYMSLRSWENDDSYTTISHRFYDKDGNQLSANSTIPEEKDLEMFPTSVQITGAFDNYLYVPLEGNTYRYERTEMDVNSVTTDTLLYRFTEKADPQNVEWSVYSVKEYLDLSVVLANAGEDYVCVYQYSPSKRAGADALQNAKEAGCVIHMDGDVAEGQDAWQVFVKAAEAGKAGSVDLAYYYTLDGEYCSEQYYEVYKEDYPALYRKRLTYDGNSYTIKWTEGSREYVKQYQYLMHYTGDAPTESATFDTYSRYVLTNNNTVTWEELEWGLLSSRFGDYIDHYTVYTDLQ